MKTIESDLQMVCVRWFRLQHPKYSSVFFSVPNGGLRSKKTACIIKAEGAVSGVADLLLLVPSGEFHGLCIEMKSQKGKQQETQKQFETAVTENGYKYVICRSIYEFIDEINNYLKK